jgi:hypothetical protein
MLLWQRVPHAVLWLHQVHEEDILLVKGPTGAPERKPFDTRRESTEREWFLVRSHHSSTV